MRIRIRQLFFASLLSCAPPPEGPPVVYVDTVTMAVDCRATPTMWGIAVDPARPLELFGEDLVSNDGGVHWQAISDGTEQVTRAAFPRSLGDGRWFVETSPANLSAPVAYIVDLPSLLASRLSLTVGDVPLPGFRSSRVDDGLWVGIDPRRRVWKSADGTTWTGVDGFAADNPLQERVTVARGNRVWTSLAGAEGGLEVSSDGGRTFVPRSLPDREPGVPFKFVRNIALGLDNRAFVQFWDPSVHPWIWLTDDDGLTWSRAGGDPDWVERADPGAMYLASDDTLLTVFELNVDSARPNPSGQYLVRSPDLGETFEILLLKAGATTVLPPLNTPTLFDLGSGRIAFSTREGWCTTATNGAGSIDPTFTLLP